jgi:hypothetical protein
MKYTEPVPPRPLALRILAAVAVAVTAAVAGIASCDAPIGAMRRSPPEGVEARAISASAWAPDFRLEGTQGPFALEGAVADENALLVFYRGHW